MKTIFEQTVAECKICLQPTCEQYKRGEYYYCADHYEKESPQEKRENEKNRIELEKHKKFVATL